MEQIDTLIKDVAVIGAAGKMGRGIALLMLQEMAKREAHQYGAVGTGAYRLRLIDTQDQFFTDIKHYLRSHMTRFAEKNINALRTAYAKNLKLISNEEIIDDFVQGSMDILRFDTKLDSLEHVNIIFEAIIEDVDVKTQLFSTLDAICKPDVFYLTNTSAIPIQVLQDQAELGNRIMGFHFYNPPHIQKLVEVIYPDNADPAMKDLATELGTALKKILVVSKDVAGFIGNGHFLREVHYACQLVDSLSKNRPQSEAIYIVNKFTQDLLVRPMGIFQLIDYVGLDIAQKIAQIMLTYLAPEKFANPLIDQMLKLGIKGGQNPDGSPKDGFFKYERNTPVAIYSLADKKYIPLQEGNWAKACDQYLGKYPEGWQPWKILSHDPNKNEKLQIYFQNLYEAKTPGADLARSFLAHSREIAKKLAADSICSSMQDLNTALEHGFYHLYGPDSIFLEEVLK